MWAGINMKLPDKRLQVVQPHDDHWCSCSPLSLWRLFLWPILSPACFPKNREAVLLVHSSCLVSWTSWCWQLKQSFVSEAREQSFVPPIINFYVDKCPKMYVHLSINSVTSNHFQGCFLFWRWKLLFFCQGHLLLCCCQERTPVCIFL